MTGLSMNYVGKMYFYRDLNIIMDVINKFVGDTSKGIFQVPGRL